MLKTEDNKEIEIITLAGRISNEILPEEAFRYIANALNQDTSKTTIVQQGAELYYYYKTGKLKDFVANEQYDQIAEQVTSKKIERIESQIKELESIDPDSVKEIKGLLPESSDLKNTLDKLLKLLPEEEKQERKEEQDTESLEPEPESKSPDKEKKEAKKSIEKLMNDDYDDFGQ